MPRGWRSGFLLLGLSLAAILTLVACAPMAPAPVEDREGRRAPPTAPPARTGAPRAVAPPIYTVQRGDTLYSIAFRYGLDWRDVAAWNRIGEPFVIRPGQELRLIAPPALARTDPTPPATEPRRAPAPEPTPAPAPAPTTPPAPREPVQAPAPSAPAPAPRAETTAPPPVAGDAATRTVAGVTWRWPTEGRVVRPFDAAATRRGIGIGGRTGQPVVAAADGRVVYSGTALIGYGELIIIKHNDTMLSAYAHNRVRLVEEGATVRAGQQIAEMGVSNRDEELLHFEIRRNGQPENPLNFLPRR